MLLSRVLSRSRWLRLHTGTESAGGALATLVLSAQRPDGTIDIERLDRSIAQEEEEGEEQGQVLPPDSAASGRGGGEATPLRSLAEQHDSKDLETLRLSVLGQTPPRKVEEQGQGGGPPAGSVVAKPTLAPYPVSTQTAELIPLQERSANQTAKTTDTSVKPPQRRARGGGGGGGGGCCGSRPR
jgi:hypothetical protein